MMPTTGYLALDVRASELAGKRTGAALHSSAKIQNHPLVDQQDMNHDYCFFRLMLEIGNDQLNQYWADGYCLAESQQLLCSSF